MASIKSSRSKPTISNDNTNDPDIDKDSIDNNNVWLTFLVAAYYQFGRINNPDDDQSMTIWDAQWSALFYARSLALSIHYYGREIYTDPHPEYGQSYETLDTPLTTDINKIALVLTMMDIIAFGYIRKELGDGGIITPIASIIIPYIKPTLRHIRIKFIWSNPNVTPVSSDSILTAEKQWTQKIKHMDEHHDETGVELSEEEVEKELIKIKEKENIFVPGKEGYIKFRNRLKNNKYWQLTPLTFHQIERYCVY